MVYGELGRYPLNIEYTSRCILFWTRIISGPVSKLSVKMYNLLYKMYDLGIYNSPWLSFVKSTLLSAGFGYVWRDQKIPRTLEYFKKVFKTRLKDQYLQTWTDDVASNAKCINYRMYKSDISLEFYITFLPMKLRTVFSRFRCRNHKLPVKTGIYKNIPRSDVSSIKIKYALNVVSQKLVMNFIIYLTVHFLLIRDAHTYRSIVIYTLRHPNSNA